MNPNPPKAEVTGSNPVGCAKNPYKYSGLMLARAVVRL